MAVQQAWWKTNTPHEGIWAHLNFIDKQQNIHSKLNADHLRLYGNVEITGLNTMDYSKSQFSSIQRSDRITFNVVQSAIDTLTSKIGEINPRAMFLTDGGDWDSQRRAKGLTKFIDGCIHSTSLYSKGSMIFRSGCIFGDGFLKIFEEDGKIKCEKVFADEVKVDDIDGIYGLPRVKYQVKFIPREILTQKFPKYTDQILNAETPKNRASVLNNTQTDQVIVFEAWHLPSGKGAKDGKHAITISNATLFQEPYKRDKFPIEKFAYCERELGYYSQGLAEQLRGIQREMNKLLRTIQLSFHLLGVPKIFIEEGSNVVTGHINNEIGTIIKYRGTKPDVHSFQTVNPEIFNQLDRLYSRAFEIAGISQLSAIGKKPAGMNAGVALREVQDIESERFQTVQKAWQNWYIRVFEQFIDLAEEIYQRDGKFEFVSVGKKHIEVLNWKDIRLEKDQYNIQVFPVSALPKTPAGRKQEIIDLMDAGMISQDTAKDLLDFPDIQAETDLERSGRDIVRERISKIIEDGEYTQPEQFFDVAFAIKYTQQQYCKGLLDKLPEERLSMLRQYINECEAIMQAANPPAPPEVGQGVPAGAIPSPEAIPQGSLASTIPQAGGMMTSPPVSQ